MKSVFCALLVGLLFSATAFDAQAAKRKSNKGSSGTARIDSNSRYSERAVAQLGGRSRAGQYFAYVKISGQ